MFLVTIDFKRTTDTDRVPSIFVFRHSTPTYESSEEILTWRFWSSLFISTISICWQIFECAFLGPRNQIQKSESREPSASYTVLDEILGFGLDEILGFDIYPQIILFYFFLFFTLKYWTNNPFPTFPFHLDIFSHLFLQILNKQSSNIILKKYICFCGGGQQKEIIQRDKVGQPFLTYDLWRKDYYIILYIERTNYQRNRP